MDGSLDGSIIGDAGPLDGASDVDADARPFIPPTPPGRVFALSGSTRFSPGLFRWDITSLPGDGGVDGGTAFALAYDMVRVGDRLYVGTTNGPIQWHENLGTSVDGPKSLGSVYDVNSITGRAFKLAYAAATDSLYALTSYYPDCCATRAAISRYDNASTILENTFPAATYQLLIDIGLPHSEQVDAVYGLAAGADDRVYVVRMTQQGSDLIAVENASKGAGTSTPPLLIRPQVGFFAGWQEGPFLATDSGRIWVGGWTNNGPEVRGYDLANFGSAAAPIVPDLSKLAGEKVPQIVAAIDATSNRLVVAAGRRIWNSGGGNIVVFANASGLQSGANPQYTLPYPNYVGGWSAVRYMPTHDIVFAATSGRYLGFFGPLSNPGLYVVNPWRPDGTQAEIPGFVRIEPVGP